MKGNKLKILRITTVPVSLDIFCRDILRELSVEYDVVAVSSPGPELERVAEREGVRVVPLSICRRISVVRDVVSLVSLVRLMRRERPWLVHSMTPKAGLLSMIAAWLARVPYRVHSFTGLVWPTMTGVKRRVLIAADRLLCACATHVIPEGEGVKRDLLAARVTARPLRVLANGSVRGVDLSWYDRMPDVMASAEMLRDDNLFTFVFVGRVVRDKGVNELVEAFVQLNGEITETRLLLVGDFEQSLDPVSAETLSLIESHGAINAVGPQSDVRPWLAAADVLVLPSYREGFPNVVIEAGAMGLPSIVTDINGSNEIIINECNGLIVPRRNSPALRDAMRRVARDKNLWLSMRSQARPMIASRYDCHDVRRALYDFYKSLQD